MPLSPTYPGVYIEEVPSSVRTISGVATSITAFVGRALRGPIDEPRRISSWGDFERKYGGLWKSSTMSYAVQQYFLNGGVDAVIARLVHDTEGAVGEIPAAASSLGSATGEELWTFQATTPGAVAITITITHPDDDVGVFDITITSGATTDVVAGVVVGDLVSGQTLGDNDLITIEGTIPSIRPDAVAGQALTGGVDASFASATAGPVVVAAATIGAHGNNLRATVGDGSDPAHYNLRFELLDEDDDVLATAAYDVTPGSAWPAPTLDNTSVTLVTLPGANAPGVRPPDGSVDFVDGTDHERGSTTVGVTIAGLPLEAANPGAWGDSLRASFDYLTADPSDTNLFNVTIFQVDPSDNTKEVSRETFRNVSIDPDSKRYVKQVLEEQSDLVRLPGAGPFTRPPETPAGTLLAFTGGNDGEDLETGDYTGSPADKTGIYLLEKTDLFNLLVIAPPTRDSDTDPTVWSAALKYCKDRRAVLLVDAPAGWTEKDDVVDNLTSDLALASTDPNATNGAIYWPQLKFADPLQEFRLQAFPPAGAIAGVIARTDAQRGVWSAPAGTDAGISGVRALTAAITDNEHGQINPLGVNVVRILPRLGTLVWGARTIAGADVVASEWKYLPVRRVALFVEESLYRGTQWAVFQGNDDRLWAQLRLNVTSFMHDLFRKGAFQGTSPRDAYLVKCDGETTTQSDIDRGIVNVLVGFRPLKPAEFVIIKISQLAGQVGA